MAHSFHPFPAVRMAQVLISWVVLTGLLVYYGSTLGQLQLPVIGVVGILSLIFLVLVFLRSRFETVTLEDKAISHTVGLLSTKKVVVPYSHITETKYSQSIMHRILGVGSLRVDSAGGSDVAINVEEVRKKDLDSILAAISDKSHPEGGK